MHYPILRNSIIDMDIQRNGITVVKLLFLTPFWPLIKGPYLWLFYFLYKIHDWPILIYRQ